MVTPERHLAMVDRLVQETRPVRRLWSVRARLLIFTLASAAVFALVAFLSPRADLDDRLREPAFLLGVAVLLVATVYTASLALRSAVPGREPATGESTLAFVLIVGAFLFTCVQSAAPPPTGASLAGTGWPCAVRTFAIALLPWAGLLIAIRRGAPVRVAGAGAYAGASALLLSTAILRVACPADGGWHWLAWHFAPLAFGIALSALTTGAWLHGWYRAQTANAPN